ncbi:hypothetical protein H2201_005270 [Coniosporium apollinis]|uniref:Uncharacterized protein n=1 Tax=Coniosporium apollinis TaxID=61459 RepID=A0ABQ9NWX0_9PEZI|nr:hypothetical protein H2201_005270 [Coniosporium apollinis]
MSSPPRTPTYPPSSSHRRHPSSFDLSPNPRSHNYNSYFTTPSRSPISRRSSAVNYQYSPVTPRSIYDARPGSRGNELSELDGVAGGDGGLGNLADELADMWEDDEGEGERGYDAVDGEAVELGNGNVRVNGHRPGSHGGARDGSIVASSPPTLRSPQQPSRHRSNHQRKPSQLDGSEDGGERELNASGGISAGLEAEIAALESIARRGAEQTTGDTDQGVHRFTESLRDLGSQAAIEAGATRLTNAYTAQTTHLTTESRTMASLTSTLLSPLSPAPPPEIIDTLLALIPETIAELPSPSSTPLYALHALTRTTQDLVQTLSYLSDSLHMSRQTTQVAARRLRAVKYAVTEMARERELAEEGRRWIEQEGWEDRLARRECKGVCADVVGGFEKVCEGWRERLLAGAEAVG